MRKLISLVFVITMIVYVHTQTCARSCVCDNGVFPCEECANTLIQKKNADENQCFICPGAICTACSANYVCSQFDACPDPDTEKPDTYGQRCVSCQLSNCLNCFFPDICQRCQPGYRFTNDGGCQPIPECEVQNCDLCFRDRLNTCRICADGFFLDKDFKCSSDRCVVDGCLECQNGNNFQCRVCDAASNYTKVGNTCVLPCRAPLCSKCVANSATVCEECVSGYIYNPVKQFCQPCRAAGCDVCANVSTDRCLVCKKQFRLNSLGKCR